MWKQPCASSASRTAEHAPPASLAPRQTRGTLYVRRVGTRIVPRRYAAERRLTVAGCLPFSAREMHGSDHARSCPRPSPVAEGAGAPSTERDCRRHARKSGHGRQGQPRRPYPLASNSLSVVHIPPADRSEAQTAPSLFQPMLKSLLPGHLPDLLTPREKLERDARCGRQEWPHRFKIRWPIVA
jgi:hypothetical protein